MNDIADTLEDGARDTATTVQELIDWTRFPANEKTVAGQKPHVLKELMRGAISAKRLAKAAQRPMAVAVFGASQVGKSHLISVLARKDDTLQAVFDGIDEPVSYIDKINPDKGTEATGLVTRFTIHRSPTPDGFPVQLELLEHADIIKILANSYFFDGNPARYEECMEPQEITAHVDAFRQYETLPEKDNGLTPEDAWDLEAYLSNNIKESELTKRLRRSEFWEVSAKIINRLTLEQCAAFFAILWGRHQALTDVYLSLVTGLEKLAFARDAFVPLSAIDVTVPDVQSILDVSALDKLADSDGSGENVDVRGSEGHQASLPRPVVTALTAELRICLKDRPWDFFDHTDLLDFPGYRGRGLKAKGMPGESDGDEPQGLAKAFETALSKTVSELMLRGKVEYLFQRYVAEQEITAMLLCVKESNMDVVQLPDVISRWIASTHGQTPEDRSARQTLLYFVLTRFDMHFEEKVSDGSLGVGARFEGRMKASLLDPFGSSEKTWVQNWANGLPFRNCFLMRNPNVRNRAMFEFDDRTEAAILPDRVDWVKTLREAFISVEAVQRHFADPERAFDEMMRLNDGGSRYIAENLASVCKPSVKTDQVRASLNALRRHLTSVMTPFYVPTDIGERIKERLEVYSGLAAELDEADQNHKLGTLLKGLTIDPIDLREQLYRADFPAPETGTGEARDNEAKPEGQDRKPAEGRRVPGRRVPGRRALEQSDAGSPRSSEGPAPNGAGPAVPVQSLPYRQALTVVEAWQDNMYEIASNQHFCQEVGVSADKLGELVTEVASAARRQKLIELLSEKIAEQGFAGDRRDLAHDKATVVSSHYLNKFISDLGFSLRPDQDRLLEIPYGDTVEQQEVFAPRPVTYDATGIGAQAAPLRDAYVSDWLAALYRTVEENASSEDGLNVDVIENTKLGDALDRLRSQF